MIRNEKTLSDGCQEVSENELLAKLILLYTFIATSSVRVNDVMNILFDDDK